MSIQTEGYVKIPEEEEKLFRQLRLELALLAYTFLILIDFGFWASIWLAISSDVPPVLGNPENFFISMVIMVMLSLLVWQFGRIQRHFKSKEAFLWFCIPTLLFPGIYHCITAWLPPSAFPMLSAQGFEQLAIGGWFLLIGAVLIIFALLVYHLKLVSQLPRFECQLYIGMIITLLAGLGLIAGVGSAWGYSFHLHHYIWSFLFANFTLFETRISTLCQAVCFGIMIQETSSLGALSFYDDPSVSSSSGNVTVT